MGVLIRFASHTVDNPTIVFFRNVIGLLVLMPFLLTQGVKHLKTSRIWMHAWRSVVGLIAMYGFFYAIAHLKEVRAIAGPKPTVISVGGLGGPEDARARLDAGADLLQVYTEFVYAGPGYPHRMAKALGRP
ncbi:MAG: hypothetical protein EOP04_15720 [Proteobacteria bacterium]|nr:MAG: hypothetical protein EOP04_15720 [Pseudomonadota bacterium]